MFQYTTETIINSNKGKLASGKRFEKLQAGPNNEITRILIDGVIAFDPACITKVYRTPYREAEKSKAELTLGDNANSHTTGLVAGDIVRLTVSIREQGSVRSTIQNAYLYKNKPFHYELEVPAATSEAGSTVDKELVKAIAKLIKKDMAMTDFAYFKASSDITGTDPKLILEADDCYIQFVDVKLEKVLDAEDPSVAASMPLPAKLLGINVVAAVPYLTLSVTPGDEGQGTVARLVKNLRIPTGASINPFGADQGGKPVPGGEYDQFLVEYETDRAHVSGTVVGSVGEKSRTSHVFFINSAVAGASSPDTLADDFAALFTGITIIPAGRPAKGASRSAGTANAVDTISTSAAGVTELSKKDAHTGSVE